MIPTEHHVKIGQIRQGTEGDILKAILGSCVGIAIFWKRRKLYALAHCLLPEAPPAQPDCKAKFVSQAVPNLIKILEAEHNKAELEAVISGGSQMMLEATVYASKFGKIGEENLRAAKKYLDLFKIKTIAVIPGGDQGSQIIVDCTTGEYIIKKISKME